MAQSTYLILEAVQAAVGMEGVLKDGTGTPIGLLPNPGQVPSGPGAAVDVKIETVFQPRGRIQAYSGDSAVRKAAEKHGGGRFVAVTERAWHEGEFKAEDRPVLTRVTT